MVRPGAKGMVGPWDRDKVGPWAKGMVGPWATGMVGPCAKDMVGPWAKCMIGPWAKGTLRAQSYQIEHKLLDTFFLAPTLSNQVVKHAPPALGLQHLESMPSSGTAWHYLLTGHPGKNISLTNEEWFYHNLWRGEACQRQHSAPSETTRGSQQFSITILDDQHPCFTHYFCRIERWGKCINQMALWLMHLSGKAGVQVHCPAEAGLFVSTSSAQVSCQPLVTEYQIFFRIFWELSVMRR